MKIYRSVAGKVFILTLLASLVGAIQQLLTANFFGTSKALDNYWLAISYVALFLFYIHPLREALITSANENTSSAKGGQYIYSAGALLPGSVFLISLFVAAVFQLIGGGAPTTINSLLIALIPYAFFWGISETCSAIVISLGGATQQALIRFITALVGIAILWALAEPFGLYALVVSVTSVQAATAIFLLVVLRLQGQKWSLQGYGFLLSRRFWSMFLALSINYFFAQLYIYGERVVLGELRAGAVSAFQYAVLLPNLIVSLFAQPIVSVIWPTLLESVAKNDSEAAVTLARESAGFVVLCTLGASAFVFLNASELVFFIFKRGEFDQQSWQLTTLTLRATSLAAVPVSLVVIALRCLISAGRGSAAATVGIAMALGGLSVLLTSYWLESLGLAVVHWLASNALGAILAWSLLTGSPLRILEFNSDTKIYILKAMLILFVSSCSIYLINQAGVDASVQVLLFLKFFAYSITYLGLTYFLFFRSGRWGNLLSF